MSCRKPCRRSRRRERTPYRKPVDAVDVASASAWPQYCPGWYAQYSFAVQVLPARAPHALVPGAPPVLEPPLALPPAPLPPKLPAPPMLGMQGPSQTAIQ